MDSHHLIACFFQMRENLVQKKKKKKKKGSEEMHPDGKQVWFL